MKKNYYVVAGILIRQSSILCGKRKGEFFASKWEFPGGKIQPGETKTEALRREIKEEIDCDVKELVFFRSSVAENKDFIIYLDSYLINCNGDIPKNNVHSEIKWIPFSELTNYDWCDADRIIVENIVNCHNIFLDHIKNFH